MLCQIRLWALALVCFSCAVQGAPSAPVFRVWEPAPAADTCGYQSCPSLKPGYLNVHLVPHTHDDVGWLKTVDQYYYGAKSNIQKAGVQYILDSVIDALQVSPDRRFIYVETGFFYLWWNEQTEATRQVVRDLVNAGRLEFINGGWCMNDEATTHYADIIDQMTLGLKFLNETFGECGRPRIAWQIDPFGHSKEQANLFALMGFDGLFFGRLDYEDKKLREATQTMEMVWEGNLYLGDKSHLFTGALHNLYQPPPGYCYDILCDDEPIIDNPESKDYNVPERIQNFLNYCQDQAKAYKTSNILLTMGSDFQYMDAHVWYKNMDKLIRYANALQANGSMINLVYSTPSCYLKAVNEANLSWNLKKDDFFPYGSDAHSYWTGYFTSRPALKYMVRKSGGLLQTCKQIDALAFLRDGQERGNVNNLKEAMAIAQHHDAVAGTEKEHVASDYARRLHEGTVDCLDTITSSYQTFLPLNGATAPEMGSCLQLNVSQCSISEENPKFVVTIHNPLARSVRKYIRLPIVYAGAYDVLDDTGAKLTVQAVVIPTPVLNLAGRTSSARSELVFLAELPPLGYRSYYVRRVFASSKFYRSAMKTFSAKSKKRTKAGDIFVLQNEYLNVTIGENGLMREVQTPDWSLDVSQEFLWYAGMNGDNIDSNRRASGAYIFRPDGIDANTIGNATVTNIVAGPLVSEIHQVYTPWLSQVIRLYMGESHIELDWVVGPIPVEDKVGKEIISRIKTGMETEEFYYTDSNGRQTVKRIINYRPTWNLTVTEPVSGNYYPVNTHIFLHNNGQQVSLVTDRAQGGGAIHDREFEVMVHRRLLHDDAFGVGEALNEPGVDGEGLVVRGTHYLVVGRTGTAMRTIRALSQELYMRPELTLAPTNITFEEWQSSFKMQETFLAAALPPNVHLLTLERWSNDKVLLRLEHIFDSWEDNELAWPVDINLGVLFAEYDVAAVEETMLAANQYTKDSSRLPWTVASTKTKSSPSTKDIKKSPEADFIVTLNPMDIRTFILTVAKKTQ